jgi:DNA-binding NtrC family response regulator
MSDRILVVDDDEYIRLLYKKELADEFFEVKAVAGAVEAFAAMEEGTFQAIVLDIELDDMSGLEALCEFRKIAPETPVIINTAYSVYKSDFKSWMADAYVAKSSDLNPLKSKIRELVCLDGSRTRPNR